MSGARVATPKMARDAGPAGRGRVLVVEDVPEDREHVERILRDASFEPVGTDQPDDLANSVGQWSPRAIILSADMPRGFTACHRLKKDKALRRIPVILVSGRAGPDVIRKHRLLPTRADHYLDKPVDGEELRRVLAELLPEEVPGPAREMTVSEVPDRTLVGGGLETAVVTYVEEEVSSLKSRLNAKVQALEQQLAQERERLDATLRALAEHQKAERETVIRERLEAAREDGRREAREEARVHSEALRSRVVELEAALETSRKQEEALRAEIAQNQVLFERLEAGYKESIATAEEEKRAMEASLSALENEVDSLRAERDALKAAVRELPALQETGARCEMLQEELGRVRAEKDDLGARVAALTAEVESLKEGVAEVATLEEANQALREELQKARDELAAAEEARKAAEEALASMRSEQEEMREMFRRLKSVLDSGLDG